MEEKKKINEILAITFVMTCIIALMEGRSITTLFCSCIWIYMFVFVQSQKKDL
jgi:hypothetical protein